jgi:hypothetical protein
VTSWEVTDDATVSFDSVVDATQGVVWRDLAIDTVQGVGEPLSVLIERVVSVQILEMRSTSTQESLRAIRELRGELVITPALHILPSELVEAQTVYHSLIASERRRPIFVSHARVVEDVGEHSAPPWVGFLGPLANELAGAPEETWRERSLAYLGGAEEKSPWADAIGLLYSSLGIAAALGLPEAEISNAVEDGLLLVVESSAGERLFPAAQVRRDSRVVRGLQWILGQLDEEAIDRYTLAAWMNQKHEDLDDLSVWDVLRESEDVSDAVRNLVFEFRTSLSR